MVTISIHHGLNLLDGLLPCLQCSSFLEWQSTTYTWHLAHLWRWVELHSSKGNLILKLPFGDLKSFTISLFLKVFFVLMLKKNMCQISWHGGRFLTFGYVFFHFTETLHLSETRPICAKRNWGKARSWAPSWTYKSVKLVRSSSTFFAFCFVFLLGMCYLIFHHHHHY